jgi:hypothetical protein
MIQILNGERPNHMAISEEHMAWFRAYMSGDENEITDRLAAMFAGVA